MEPSLALARLALAVRLAAPESPERDSALVALNSAARAEGLRGSAALAVLAAALRAEGEGA